MARLPSARQIARMTPQEIDETATRLEAQLVELSSEHGRTEQIFGQTTGVAAAWAASDFQMQLLQGSPREQAPNRMFFDAATAPRPGRVAMPGGVSARAQPGPIAAAAAAPARKLRRPIAFDTWFISTPFVYPPRPRPSAGPPAGFSVGSGPDTSRARSSRR